MGGYAFVLNSQYGSSAHMAYNGAIGYNLETTGVTATHFVTNGDTSATTCNTSYADPTDNLLTSARQLMFRTALAYGNASTVQTVSTYPLRVINVDRSHYLFLGIAVGLTMIAIGLVSATFYGYWKLGRSMTLSPVELANAFGSPPLADACSNSSASGIVKGCGDRGARYGAMSTVGIPLEQYGLRWGWS